MTNDERAIRLLGLGACDLLVNKVYSGDTVDVYASCFVVHRGERELISSRQRESMGAVKSAKFPMVANMEGAVLDEIHREIVLAKKELGI